jgi:hypothetical protein
LAAIPSSSLLPMTGTNCKTHWSWRLISPSLVLSISSQITAPVYSPSVNSPSNYLIPILYLFIYLAPLHPNISTCTFIFCTSITPVFNWYILITSPPWPIYCLTTLILPHLHKLYILFSTVLLTMCLFIPCETLCCCIGRTALLYSWPGRSCKWEFVLN